MADLLSIGRSGLSASKTSIETAAHNLSNVNTEGYSRQRVIQSTNTPAIKGGIWQGTGVKIKGIERFHDKFLEKRLGTAISDHNFSDERAFQLEQVENIFNEIDSEGLNKILNRFYNSFRELANQPENETIRSVVRDSANLVAKDFKRIRENLDDISRNMDLKLTQEVSDINVILHNIAKLNKTLTSMEASGDETADLRDQRDLLVRTLSESIGIQTYLDNKGSFTVNAAGIGTLVSGGQVQELLAARVGKEDSPYGSEGSVEVFFKERPSIGIGSRFAGGKIASIMKTRNEDLAAFKKDIDTIAYEVINTTNAVHRRGVVNRKIDTSIEGMPTHDNVGPLSGINFFMEPKELEGAAANIALSDEVRSDLSNIVTATGPNAPGDNRIALAISKLQHQRIFAEGTKTIEEQYLSSLGRIGVLSGKAKLDTEQSEGILTQTKALRERSAGVSIDEETSNLMRFQHAYDASAKMLKTADELFETVLNIKR